MHDYELYGYSLFETLAAHKGRFWQPRAHWSRLCKSALALGFPPPAWDEFRERLRQAHDATRDEVLRYTLLRTGGGWSQPAAPGWRTQVLSKPWLTGHDTLRLAFARQRLAPRDPARRFKTGSRLALQIAFAGARDAGFDDCLLLDTDDRVLETAMGNVFAHIDGTWLTPSPALCLLPGVCRQWVLRRAPVREAVFTRSDLRRARAIAVSNAVIGVKAVAAIGRRHLDVTLADALAAACGKRRFRPL